MEAFKDFTLNVHHHINRRLRIDNRERKYLPKRFYIYNKIFDETTRIR